MERLFFRKSYKSENIWAVITLFTKAVQHVRKMLPHLLFVVGVVGLTCIVLGKLFRMGGLLGLVGSKGGRNFPPGPWCFPWLGYMPFFAYKPLERLEALASGYGELCTIFLGRYRVVVLNSYYTIREAFKAEEDAFSGRPNLKMLEVRNGGGVNVGLVCSSGKIWAEQRKFTLKHLRDLGFGKQSMEGLVLQEVEELVSYLGSKVGTPLDLKSRLNLAVLNALWSIICGQRYSHDDARLQEILQKTSADLSETSYTGPLLFLPWLLKLAPSLTRWNDFVRSIKSVHSFLLDIIQEHKGNKESNKGCDFIDLYLSEIDATTDPDSSFYKDKGEHSLLIVLLDLFMAGADTTSATLYWAFLFMVLHEDVQRKVHNEIDFIIGNSFPCLEHRKLMPYTEATLQEILRKSSLVPMGLFHSTTSHTQLLGFDIPKDTVIMANMYHLNYDTKYWGDPLVFRPERFLELDEASGTTRVKKFERFIPFSTGKRSCPGKNLAMDQLFLFFVGVLQKFRIVADYAKPKPSDEPNHGVILTAKSYSVVIRSRVVGGVQ